MTPRQMTGFLQLAQRRKVGDQAQWLTLLRAAQADQTEFHSFIRKLQDEAQ